MLWLYLSGWMRSHPSILECRPYMFTLGVCHWSKSPHSFHLVPFGLKWAELWGHDLGSFKVKVTWKTCLLVLRALPGHAGPDLPHLLWVGLAPSCGCQTPFWSSLKRKICSLMLFPAIPGSVWHDFPSLGLILSLVVVNLGLGLWTPSLSFLLGWDERACASRSRQRWDLCSVPLGCSSLFPSAWLKGSAVPYTVPPCFLPGTHPPQSQGTSAPACHRLSLPGLFLCAHIIVTFVSLREKVLWQLFRLAGRWVTESMIKLCKAMSGRRRWMMFTVSSSERCRRHQKELTD